MTLRNRHAKLFTISFSLFYSFFILFAVFHNHNINFQSKDSLVIHQNEQSNKVFDPFIDGDSVCQLYQFNTLKVLPELGAGTNFSLLKIDTAVQITYVNQYFANNFSDLNLRAPPANA